MNRNDSKLHLIETGNRYGYMNAASFPKEWSQEEKKEAFIENRIKAGRAYGFDWHQMFMLDQTNKDGSYFAFTKDYVEAHPNGWTDVPEDIGIITKDAPGIVVGHPVADCPVIVMQDIVKGVTAVAHCGCAQIDRKLPMMMADALLDFCESRDEDIATYVGACAGDSWTYKGMPSWATDMDMWLGTGGIVMNDEYVKNKDGIYVPKLYIDLRKTIAYQLQERNLQMDQVRFNMDDTITNDMYYSNHAASADGLNQKEKAGRNFTGAFYKVKKR